MEELLKFGNQVLYEDWNLFFRIPFIFFVILSILIYIYDKYIQNKNQLLKNYPLIGRLRYFFYLLRDPMRQYFGDEEYFDSHEKIDWINQTAKSNKIYYSFSVSKPYDEKRVLFKHSNSVLNFDEVDDHLQITFGKNQKEPFTAKSIIGRSAMSDGAISPEGTRAFSMAAQKGEFPINTGEGSLTTNYLITHKYDDKRRYFDVIEGTFFAKSIYSLIKFFTTKNIAKSFYCDMVLQRDDDESFNFDPKRKLFFRVNWNSPLDTFPKIVPADLPDMVFQIGSGLYGVRDEENNFSDLKYKKVMSFCKMTEIKISQGAKQTGGKLPAHKVTPSVAYYRGVNPYKDLISPNRFPYAKTVKELFDFIERLQKLSNKPVGIKIVISTKENFQEYSNELLFRISNDLAYPDFITIDGGDGGSGAAPLEMMRKVGLPIRKALKVVVDELEEKNIRNSVKIIASEKVLTPDDALQLFIYGADFVNIARGFMISAGCIRARHCSGTKGFDCPVGLATMNKSKRSKYLVDEKAKTIYRYHAALINSIKGLLAIMGKRNISEVSLDDIIENK